MKKTFEFSPRLYLKTVAQKRHIRSSRTAFVAIIVSVFATGAVSLTSYAFTFSKTIEPSYVAVPQKFERLTLNSSTAKDLPEENVEDLDPEQEIAEDDFYPEDYDYIGTNGCNVLGIGIYGEMGVQYGDTTSNSVRDLLMAYGSDDRIKSILVNVDSSGGSPVAGDEIAVALSEQPVPVVAQVRELGASAAYMAILPADYIFAHRFGSVGSIGVIISLYDYTRHNNREGIMYTPIKTSPSKDVGTQDGSLTKEERAKMQAEIDFIYEEFINDVAYYRGMSYQEVKKIADGTTMLSHKAKEVGLIDEVGGNTEVVGYLRTLIKEEPVICWPVS